MEKFCRMCLECVTRKEIGRSVRPPLATIPIGGPFEFHRVVLQLPVNESGNKYVVVFANYFTKWVEAFAVPNQTAETIAHLLVEEIFCLSTSLTLDRQIGDIVPVSPRSLPTHWFVGCSLRCSPSWFVVAYKISHLGNLHHVA